MFRHSKKGFRQPLSTVRQKHKNNWCLFQLFLVSLHLKQMINKVLQEFGWWQSRNFLLYLRNKKNFSLIDYAESAAVRQTECSIRLFSLNRRFYKLTEVSDLKIQIKKHFFFNRLRFLGLIIVKGSRKGWKDIQSLLN